MILVAGGTGRLGSLVAGHLASGGHRVRVMSRGLKNDPVTLNADVEVVRADVRDPASLVRAVDGVDVVVSAVQGFLGPGGVSPESVDGQGNINLIAAAESAGADVVMVSVVGAAQDSPMELFRCKHAAEQRLRSGRAGWTIVRAEAFAETWIGVLEETAGRSGRPLVFGRGDNPIRWVSVNDVAALVELAVVDASLRGRTLDLCGPEAWTLRELAQHVMAHRGVLGKPRSVPRSMLHLMANTVGRFKPELSRQARAALAMDGLAPAEDHHTRAEFPDLPSTPVSQVLAAW